MESLQQKIRAAAAAATVTAAEAAEAAETSVAETVAAAATAAETAAATAPPDESQSAPQVSPRDAEILADNFYIKAVVAATGADSIEAAIVALQKLDMLPHYSEEESGQLNTPAYNGVTETNDGTSLCRDCDQKLVIDYHVSTVVKTPKPICSKCVFHTLTRALHAPAAVPSPSSAQGLAPEDYTDLDSESDSEINTAPVAGSSSKRKRAQPPAGRLATKAATAAQNAKEAADKAAAASSKAAKLKAEKLKHLKVLKSDQIKVLIRNLLHASVEERKHAIDSELATLMQNMKLDKPTATAAATQIGFITKKSLHGSLSKITRDALRVAAEKLELEYTPALSRTELIEMLLEASEQTYMQVNLMPLLPDGPHKDVLFKFYHSDMKAYTNEIRRIMLKHTNEFTNTLVFVNMRGQHHGNGTWLHIDPAGALNTAFGYIHAGQEPTWKRKTLAYWLFVPPGDRVLAQQVLDYGIQQRWPGYSIELKRSGVPSYSQLIACARLFKKDGVFLLKQRHGMTIEVPPGWPHLVVNMRPCVKVAVEIIRVKDIPSYILAADHMHSVFNYVGDYMGIVKVAIKQMLLI